MNSFFNLVGFLAFAILQPAQSDTKVTLKLVEPGILAKDVTSPVTLSIGYISLPTKIVLDSDPKAPWGTFTFSLSDEAIELWDKSLAELVFGEKGEFSVPFFYFYAEETSERRVSVLVTKKCEDPETMVWLLEKMPTVDLAKITKKMLQNAAASLSSIKVSKLDILSHDTFDETAEIAETTNTSYATNFDWQALSSDELRLATAETTNMPNATGSEDIEMATDSDDDGTEEKPIVPEKSIVVLSPKNRWEIQYSYDEKFNAYLQPEDGRWTLNLKFFRDFDVTVERPGRDGINRDGGCKRRMLRGGPEEDCAEESDRSSAGVTKTALVIIGALLLMVGLVVIVVLVIRRIQSTSESEIEMGPSIEYPPHLAGVGYVDDVREWLKANGEA